jgi:ribosomal protein S18 acetylase RimI-like enzyme
MTGASGRERSLGWFHDADGPADTRREIIGAAEPLESTGGGRGRAVIRPVRTAELPALVDLDRRIFGPLSYPFFVLRQLHDVHGDDLLVLAERGTLLGYSLGVSAATPGLGWFLGLGVDAAARGRGHGERLARATFARLARRGVHSVRLTVRGDDKGAVSLYHRLGFRPIDEIADYLGPGESRMLLEARLAASDDGPVPRQ